jgi:hypothetical protein
MEQRLALPRTAAEVAGFAIELDLPDMPLHCLPPPDLASIFLG